MDLSTTTAVLKTCFSCIINVQCLIKPALTQPHDLKHVNAWIVIITCRNCQLNLQVKILAPSLQPSSNAMKAGDFFNAAYHRANAFGKAHKKRTKQPVLNCAESHSLPLVASVKELTPFPVANLHQRVVGSVEHGLGLLHVIDLIHASFLVHVEVLDQPVTTQGAKNGCTFSMPRSASQPVPCLISAGQGECLANSLSNSSCPIVPVLPSTSHQIWCMPKNERITFPRP